MEAACARAVELGLPSVAFTEHLDLTPWFVPPETLHMFPREGARYLDETSTLPRAGHRLQRPTSSRSTAVVWRSRRCAS